MDAAQERSKSILMLRLVRTRELQVQELLQGTRMARQYINSVEHLAWM
jgi:hypothetical protein